MLNAIRTTFGRFGDLILAAAIVSIIFLLVVKVDPRAMDVLLTTNLAMSALVLLVALYAPDARRLPSFPTILLLTTLFRLALNVSTTRLILLDADAGSVIRAFGNVVVGGNYIVGGVVFFVLVVIQFVVIAKGAERVAEVAARFSLDAMPGKQMSIDAELRSQLITNEQARTQRHDLERESRLYGAMDGAMKFVKGDAIAGLVISVVNIVAGLLIGVYQKQMSVSDAATTYALLTIGDGLAAQIPSILTSIAAGLVVTRVASAENAQVGRDIADQFFSQPRALGVVAVMLFAIGLLPVGFPTTPFLLLGVLCSILAVVALRNSNRQSVSLESAAQVQATALNPQESLIDAPRLVLRFSGELTKSPDFVTDAQQIAQRASSDLGVYLPALECIELPSAPGSAGDSLYILELFDAPLLTGKAPANSLVALGDPSRIELAGIQVLGVEGTSIRRGFTWIAAKDSPVAQRAQIELLDSRDAVLWHIEDAIRRNAYRLVGVSYVHTLFEQLRATDEGAQLVRAVCPTPLPIQAVAEVLQRLLRELVPIRHSRLILESLARNGQTVKAPPYLTERVRRELGPIVCARLASAPGKLSAYTVDPAVEDLVRSGVEETSEGQIVAMGIDDRRLVVDAVRAALSPLVHLRADPVLLVENASIRRPLRSILERQLPEVCVLSYDELPRDIVIENAGRVTFADASA